MKISTKPVKGTRDLLPKEMELREYVKSTIKEVYQKSGFEQIETPILENIDLLCNSEGGENLKLLFKVLKRGEKLDLSLGNLEENNLVDMGLRYDLTLPLSRFYANNKGSLPIPFKSIQMGYVYRAENPQRGRYRSFMQCDIDIIGEETVIAETELILTTSKALQTLGFKDFIIRINDRRILKALILYAGFEEKDFESVCIIFDKLDKLGVEGIEKELIQKGFEKENTSRFIQLLSEIKSKNIDELNQYGVAMDVIEDIKKVVKIVESQAQEYSIIFDYSLVRGMGYYTGIVFEIAYGDFGLSLGGGGRYDKMIGRFLKQDVSACGFSIGFERIVDIMSQDEFNLTTKDKIALIYDKNNDDLFNVVLAAEKLREKDRIVSTIPRQKKLSKQLERLKEQGFTSFSIYSKERLQIKIID